MTSSQESSAWALNWSLAGAVLIGLGLVSRYNYLLFHSLAEMFSVVVAAGIFMVAWHTRRMEANPYFTVLGPAFLAVAMLDTLHSLAYEGMGVFPGSGADPATQLWIAARYLQAFSLAVAPLLILTGRRLGFGWVTAAYAGAAALASAMVLTGVFPQCYVDGVGLTAFKRFSEYLICLILLAAMALTWRVGAGFGPGVRGLLMASLSLNILSELAFTFYVGVYDLSNLVGHLCKIASCLLMYRALVATSLEAPLDSLFGDLRRRTQELEVSREHFRGLVEGVASPILLVAPEGVVLELNQEARGLLGPDADGLIGRDLAEALAAPQLRAVLGRVREDRVVRGLEAALPRGNGLWAQVIWNLAWLPATGPREGLVVVSCQDVTELKRSQRELERTVESLQTALAQVRTLSDLLPICAACKKIRDDQGYWTQVERYIEDHTGASFSHSICPDCARRLYPELMMDQ